MNTLTHTLTLRRLLSVVFATFLIGTLASCGSDDGDSGSDLPDAAGASSDAADTDDESDTEDISQEDAMLKFTECMREQGVDMPDPEPGGGMRMSGEGLSEEQMDAAHEACQKWMDLAMPEDGEAPEMSPEDKQAMLDMAQCMRDRGYDFPDPQFDGGRITQRIDKGEEGIDPEDPAFRADIDECHEESGLDMGGFGTGEKES